MSDLIRLMRSGGPMQTPGAFGIPLLGSLVPPMMEAGGMKPPEWLFPHLKKQDVPKPEQAATGIDNRSLGMLLLDDDGTAGRMRPMQGDIQRRQYP